MAVPPRPSYQGEQQVSAMGVLYTRHISPLYSNDPELRTYRIRWEGPSLPR